jgi:hypothetical protein
MEEDLEPLDVASCLLLSYLVRILDAVGHLQFLAMLDLLTT